MSGERQIELVWRCSSCNRQSLGRFTVCQGCGNPKDDSEEYEMPVDTAAVASVTDSELLRLAKAGANWSCAYCASHQRALDGSCAQCGAGKKEGANAGAKASANANANANADADAGDREHARAERLRKVLAYGTFGFVAVVVLVVGVGWWASSPSKVSSIPDPPAISVAAAIPPPRTEFDATVTEVSWKRALTVETFQLVAKEDFTADVPAGALDVRAAGLHHHHDEQVFDHNDTESYEVEVPDGTRSESYTERVSCGQDCKTTPRTCRKVCSGSPRRCSQKCTNNKNGFATCREECTGSGETCRDDCSGGGTTCTPKFCTESRTRQVPKTRREKRTRTIPRYRSEPRTAPWSTFRIAEWTRTGGSELTGDDTSPKWPDAGMVERDSGANAAPKLGEKRLTRTESLSVTLRLDDGTSQQLKPTSVEELELLPKGAQIGVRVEDGRVSLVRDGG